MSNGIGTVEVKVTRKRVRILGMGQTNTGQKFIRASTELEVSRITDKGFKEQMGQAVKSMLAQQVLVE